MLPQDTRSAAIRRLILVFAILALAAPFARPLLGNALANRAAMFLTTGRYDAARGYLRRALFFDPGNGDAATQMVLLAPFGTRAEVTANVEQLRVRLASHPTDGDAHWSLALSLERLGKPAQARTEALAAYDLLHVPQLRLLADALQKQVERESK